MKFIDRGDVVVSKLKDPKVSYVEILSFKLNVKIHLLGTWLPRSGMHVDCVTKIPRASIIIARFGLS